jgi:dienelactone hydrolase
MFNAVLAASDVSNFRFLNEPGPHPVGFRVVQQYDYSRTYEIHMDVAGKQETHEGSRPLQTLIWYPAQQTSSQRITYGAYLALLATEEQFSQMPSEAAETLREKETYYQADADPALPMWAIRDAPPDNRTFPLVLYAPSDNAPAFENADLCEYLASEGYVVIASPSVGARSFNVSGGIEDAEAEAGDISFLIGFAHSIAQVDLSNIALVGYGTGGLANLTVVARDGRISALIALDVSNPVFSIPTKTSNHVRPHNTKIPLLLFVRGEITIGTIDKGKFEASGVLLDEMAHSDVYAVRMDELGRGGFSSMQLRSPAYWKRQPPQVYSPQEMLESYGWMARYLLAFLNWTFKHDTSAQMFLKSELPPRTGPRVVRRGSSPD